MTTSIPAHDSVQSRSDDSYQGVRSMSKPKPPKEWLEYPEWIPRSFGKRFFNVETVQGVAYILDTLPEGYKVRTQNLGTDEQPRWFLNRDDMIKAWEYRKKNQS